LFTVHFFGKLLYLHRVTINVINVTINQLNVNSFMLKQYFLSMRIVLRSINVKFGVAWS